MDMIIGNVPDTVVYLCYPKEKKIHADIYSGTSNKNIDRIIKNSSYRSDTGVVDKVIAKNSVIKNLQLIGANLYESSNNVQIEVNGKPLIVKIDNKMLYDIIIGNGIDKTGYCKGDFIWAFTSGSPRLIKHKSEAHKQILEYEDRSSLEKIDRKSLVPGSLYRDRLKNNYFFVDFVDTQKYDMKTTWDSRVRNVSYAKRNIKGGLLFFQVLDIKNDDYKGSIEKSFESFYNGESTYLLFVQKTHSFIEKLGDTIELDTDVVDKIRDAASKVSAMFKSTDRHSDYQMCGCSAVYHMRKAGEGGLPASLGYFKNVDVAIEKVE